MVDDTEKKPERTALAERLELERNEARAKIAELEVENKRLKEERDAYRRSHQRSLDERIKVLRLNTSFPLTSILERLVEATRILLDDHNYDGLGWEGLYHAQKAGAELLSALTGKVE